MYPQQYPASTAASVPPLPNQYPNSIGFNSPQKSSSVSTSDERLRKFQYLVDRYEINRTFATRLRALDGYEIVFIVDDSGSMNTPLGDASNPYEQTPRRWDELRQTVSIVVDIASVFDPDGVDVFFLNREPLRHVKSSEELVPIFAIPPTGPTPIVRILRYVLREKQLEIQERKLLILIATDGVPTNEHGQQDIKSFEYALRYDRKPVQRVPVTIIACTDDNDCIGYLNDWDKKIPNLDVADDYRSEKKEILKAQGKDFPFSFGDYVVKVLMGGIDEWFDTLDEHRVKSRTPSGRRSASKTDKCAIF
ncbi:unnamed protein product [Adineta ricciae]|uniref:VWFA domain-containing protein n=1 Tax=Adineta ricciae TaxID=249248 RepID=A0A815C893_ADIRI|nr:unnamed protein product [Adineta ricciae]